MEPFEFLRRRWHRLVHRRLPEVPELRPVCFAERGGLEEVRSSGPRLTRLLTENIIPFWYPACLDRQGGGYLFNHDPSGRYRGPGEKFLIPHARTCWFFARLARTAWLPEALGAARHGFEFLVGKLWDREHGGYLWSEGDDRKLLIGQVFALYGVAEYAAVSGEARAAGNAGEIFALLEQRFHDPVQGGYRSRLSRSFGPDPDGSPAADQKTVNEHLHALEALTSYATIAPGAALQARLLELIVINTGTVLRKTAGASTDAHRTDWTPLLSDGYAAASYGHDLESVWLVLDACPAAGLPETLVLDWCRTLAGSAMRWGWDRRGGGVYFAGPLNGPAHSREKVWWVQAEAMVTALTLYQRTGDERFAELYLSVLDWVERRQADWSGGDWHRRIQPSGQVTGDKADRWTDPYHQGRAMLVCLDILGPGSSGGGREARP